MGLTHGRRWTRTRRVVLIPALVGGLLALVAAGVVGHGMATDPAVGGYPQRIGFERPSDPLPSRPGPLAATLYDNDFGAGRTLGVSATGKLWELPGGTNLLSPSGRVLLTQPWDSRHQWAVRDLTTGEGRTLHDVPSWGRMSPRAFWTPDETSVLTTLRPRPWAAGRTVLVDLSSGAVTNVGPGAPAGFLTPSRAVTVREQGGDPARGALVVTTTDLATGDTTSLPLRLATAWLGDPDAEVVASIAPDGRTLLLVEGFGDDTRVRTFSMYNGAELAPRRVLGWDGCSPTWDGRDPVLPTTSQPGGPGSTRWAGAVRLTADGVSPLVAVHPRLQSTCLQLASDALAAGPRWALFGTRTSVWTWYPVPAAAAVSLGLLGLVLLARTAHRAWGPGRRGRAWRGPRTPAVRL